jgi:catechol 2,3-dioxygenase-like lactoylglutathione lyase family enzyme
MITRLDHVVIGVRDLDDAVQAYQELGFEVQPGGRHTGLGTHNALIRFGLEYLELLAVHDSSEATRSGGPGRFMTEYQRERPGALLGFALASSNLDDEAARGAAPAVGYTQGQPFAMQRTRPDGHVLSWRLLVPGQHTWRRPWPFLIQWDTSDQQRLAWEGTGQHANGASGVTGLRVAARDVPAVISIYRDQLGLPVTSSSVALPNSPIEIVHSEDDDEGLAEVQLRVPNLNVTRDWFARQRIALNHRSAVPLERSLGAHLVFVA